MTSWLRAQRKSELIDLAEEAGLKDVEGLRKEELSAALETHLRTNAMRLSKIPSLAPFFERSRSPVKRVASSAIAVKPAAEVESMANRAYRRATKAKDELESTISDVSSTENIRDILSRTPATFQRAAAQIPLPPSPATITEAVEQQTTRLSNELQNLWDRTEIVATIHQYRDALSSIAGVQMALVLLEAYGLQRITLPWRYAFHTPYVRMPWAISGALVDSRPFYLPHFFVVLTSEFWAPTTLWLTTSLLLPLLFAYFFNLTLRSKRAPHRGPGRPATRAAVAKPTTVYKVDPLTYSIVKATVTWLVYGKGLEFGGWPGLETAAKVNSTMIGHWEGVVLGCVVGGIMSLYEAVLKH